MSQKMRGIRDRAERAPESSGRAPSVYDRGTQVTEPVPVRTFHVAEMVSPTPPVAL